eukprot:jgi/Chlat1/2379/Chrsp17S02647
MRVQCDVCDAAPAEVVCAADKAALCGACDRKVHAANKLVAKHQRVALLPQKEERPKCDICQEAAAFFFCRDDRALLCRGCDLSIHSANALTQAHDRYLVPGILVSLHALPDPEDNTASPSSESSPQSTLFSQQQQTQQQQQQPQHEQTHNHKHGKGPAVPVSSSRVAPAHHTSNTTTTNKPQQTAQIVPQLQVPTYNMPNNQAFTPSASYSAPPAQSPLVGSAARSNSTSNLGLDWRVDELLAIPDLADGYTLADVDPSKGGDLWDEIDWSLVPESTMNQLGVVPQMESFFSMEPQGSGLRARSSQYDNDDGAVPDFNRPPSPIPTKRRRTDASVTYS